MLPAACSSLFVFIAVLGAYKCCFKTFIRTCGGSSGVEWRFSLSSMTLSLYPPVAAAAGLSDLYYLSRVDVIFANHFSGLCQRPLEFNAAWGSCTFVRMKCSERGVIMIGSGFDLNHFHCKISLLLSIVRSLRNKRRLTVFRLRSPLSLLLKRTAQLRLVIFTVGI